MHRRKFIDAVAASLIAAPVSELSHASPTVRRIGILTTDAPRTSTEWDRDFAPLRALGWVEGQNLVVVRRPVSGRVELLQPAAEEIVRLKVDLIGTQGTPAARAAKNATRTIPIVLWSAGDPVATGLVASLSRPGGNVTGFSLVGPETAVKRVELARELVPGLLRIGVLEPANHPYYQANRVDFERACRSLRVEPIFTAIATQSELDKAITEISRRGAQALLVPQEPLFYENPGPLIAAASKYSLPTISSNGSILEAGGLAVLTYSEVEQSERFAWFVDKILRGAKPSELPIQQPTRFEIGVNLRAAKSLGIQVPRSVLLRATTVVG